MKLLQEFKEFAIKGNAIDMAVGIVIGAAFGTVVKSLVDDVIMPPLGKLIGGVDFGNLFINLSDGHYDSVAAAKAAGAATINYGLFINSIISFLIIAGAIFLIIHSINRLKRQSSLGEDRPSPTTKICSYCRSNDLHLEATRCPHCTANL
ncbi:MAG: large-conductance mechanosensitive channel protein MscL [Candidatus Uhrbacteria bacterium]|nr:large-conductance mechanosensitive channel protein MscL [Candidatus Uhrbacteria bacterium]